MMAVVCQMSPTIIRGGEITKLAGEKLFEAIMAYKTNSKNLRHYKNPIYPGAGKAEGTAEGQSWVATQCLPLPAMSSQASGPLQD